MIEIWRKQLKQPSGNLTTNQCMPDVLIDKLLDEDESLKENVKIEPIEFPELKGTLSKIRGLNILAGLQSTTKEGCLTLFRAVRFPTFKRMHEIVTDRGYSISNYEQERILTCYEDEQYISKRNEIKSDELFWTQPQERVVHGLPVFCLANDALQIHRAFRGATDKVVIVAIHVPSELLTSGKVKLTANSAIDLDYTNGERDIPIKDFKTQDGVFKVDFRSLRAKGVDLHEMYTADLPSDFETMNRLGITQDYFLLDIQKITGYEGSIDELFKDTKTLLENQWFLHGFFGDQNIFGRRETCYLPSGCSRLSKLK